MTWNVESHLNVRNFSMQLSALRKIPTLSVRSDIIFSIKSDGKLYTSGIIITTERASMNGKLSINTGISLDRNTVRVSNTIVVPNISSISLLEIDKYNIEGRNKIILQGDSSDRYILPVKNNDGQNVTDSLGIVSRNSILLYVYFKNDGWNVFVFTKENDCNKLHSNIERIVPQSCLTSLSNQSVLIKS